MDKYEQRRQNLIALMHKHCEGKAARLAEKIEVSASYASRMLYDPSKDGYKRIGEDMVDRIEAAFNLPKGGLDVLGDPTSLVPGSMRVVVAEPGDPDFYFIKKVKLQLRAGVTGFQTIPDIYDGDTVSLRKNWVDRKKINPATLIAMTVAGESMEPNLFEGDVVIIDTADKVMKDGTVYAFNYDGESVIKRLVKERGDWWLFSDNSDQTRHRPKGCRNGDCGIIGRVVKRETDHI